MKLRHRIKLLYRRIRFDRKQHPKLLGFMARKTLRRHREDIGEAVLRNNALVAILKEKQGSKSTD